MKKRKLWVHPIAGIYFLCMVLSDRSGIACMSALAALIHECGHLLAARWLKISIQTMRLDMMGARLNIDGGVFSYGEEWLLCAAGPLASFLASAVASVFWRILPISVVFSCVSMLLGLLNLLPIQSFDGGRMLESTLLSFTTPQKANAILRACSFLMIWLLWGFAVYFLMRVGDGLSLFCFSAGLLSRFFEGERKSL